MKKTLRTLVLASACTLTLALFGCAESERVREMQKKQATYQITYSVERDNINKRLELSNDPTQIMWFYGLSDIGNIVLSSPVVGKLSSSTKRLEPRTTDNDSSTYGFVGNERYSTNEIMGADGTYGESDQYVFWFTPEKQYFQWNGRYILSSAPVKTEKVILNLRDIDYQELERGKKAEKALKEGKKITNTLEIEGGN